MEYGAVVPNVPGSRWRPIRDIGRDPGNLAGQSPQPFLGMVERRLRYIQHAHIGIAQRQEFVHEMRCAAADVKNGRSGAGRGRAQG